MWLHIRLLEDCNLKCKHCYALDRTRSGIMGFDTYREIIDIYSEKVEVRSIDVDKRIMLSGGEPLLHKDFKAMVEYAYARQDITRISILTNGILLPDLLPFLSGFRDRVRIQVSIEGGRELDEFIRGRGHYDKALKALQLLMEMDFDYHISYTVSKENMNEYRNIVDLAVKYRSLRNNISPYIGETDNMLSFTEWEEFKQKVREYSSGLQHTPMASPRCCGWTYHCAAFIGGVTINPDGSLTGCARDNRVIGNYRDLDRFYISKGYYMPSTCMRNKWTGADKELFYHHLNENNKLTAQAH